MPSISLKRVEKAEMLIKASEKQLSEYRVGIIPENVVGDSMAYLRANEIGISKDSICAIIERLLASLALSLNVGKNIEPYQVGPLSIKIYAKYYYLSFDEIMYVFDCGSSGKYGKIYDRIDEEIIFSWLQKYDTEERISIAEKKHALEVEENKITNHEINILSIAYEKVIKEQEQNKQREENYQKFREKYFNEKVSEAEIINPNETDKRK